MRLGTIYSLIDPRTGLVRYIGQTIKLPRYRYASHKYQWKRCKGRINHVNSWIKNLAKEGLDFIMEVVEDEISEDQLDIKEIQWIKVFKSIGANLCNHTEGGGGARGVKHSEESKKKRLETLKTSELWKEKHKRQSEIMKIKYAEGKHSLGHDHLSDDRKKEMILNNSKEMNELYKNNPIFLENAIKAIQKSCCSFKEDGTIDLIFESITKACLHYGIKNSTNLVAHLKGKGKSCKGIKFSYYPL